MRVCKEWEEVVEEQLYLDDEGDLRVGRRELQDRMEVEGLFLAREVILQPQKFERRRFDLLQGLEHHGRGAAQDRRAERILD